MRRLAIHPTPTIASGILVRCILPIISCQVKINVDPDAFMFSISFTCDVNIIRAAADVKPDDTGPDTKSIIKPAIKIQRGFTPTSYTTSTS